MSKKAIIRDGKIIYGDDIVANQPLANETSSKHNREAMKTKHRKDLLQKNQVEYYKQYPEQAKNLSPELRRLLS